MFVFKALIPSHPKGRPEPPLAGNLKAPPFYKEELSTAVCSIRNRKALRLDGLQAEIFKAVVQSHPNLLLEMYNSCLAAEKFPVT